MTNPDSIFPEYKPLPFGEIEPEKLDDCISNILSKDLTEEDLSNELLHLYGKVKRKVADDPKNAKICVEIIAQIRKAKHWDKDDTIGGAFLTAYLMAKEEARKEITQNPLPRYVDAEYKVVE